MESFVFKLKYVCLFVCLQHILYLPGCNLVFLLLFIAFPFNGFCVVYFVNPLPSLFVELLCDFGLFVQPHLPNLWHFFYQPRSSFGPSMYSLCTLPAVIFVFVFIAYPFNVLFRPLSSLFVELAPFWFVWSASQASNQTQFYIIFSWCLLCACICSDRFLSVKRDDSHTPIPYLSISLFPYFSLPVFTCFLGFCFFVCLLALFVCLHHFDRMIDDLLNPIINSTFSGLRNRIKAPFFFEDPLYSYVSFFAYIAIKLIFCRIFTFFFHSTYLCSLQ